MLFVLAFIIAMLHPLLGAEFALIDDHEIVTILGRDNHVRAVELPHLIRDWAIEDNGRFRPGYYVLRILETYGAGGNAALWYADRLVMASVSAFALYWGLRAFLAPFYAAVVTLLFFSGGQNQVWTCLGPAEAYGVPLMLSGVAALSVGLSRGKWRPAELWPGFFLLLLAGFIKESFIPVLPAALVFVYLIVPFVIPLLVGRRSQFWWRDMAVLAALVTGIVSQVGLTIMMLRAYQHQYGAETSITSFLSAIRPLLLAYTRTLWFVPLGVALAIPFLRHGTARPANDRRSELLKAIGLVLAAAVLVLLPQAVIYGGNVSIQGRYLTPGNLFVALAAAVGFRLLSTNVIDGTVREARGVAAGILVGASLLGMLATYRDSQAMALASQQFQSRLDQILETKAKHPGSSLLFYSANVYDREALVSVARYLAVRLPEGERPFLQPYEWDNRADSTLDKALAKLLTDQSRQGDEHFAPFDQFPAGRGDCIAVVVSGVGDAQCRHVVRIVD